MEGDKFADLSSELEKWLQHCIAKVSFVQWNAAWYNKTDRRRAPLGNSFRKERSICNMKVKLPLGVDSFQKLRTNNCSISIKPDLLKNFWKKHFPWIWSHVPDVSAKRWPWACFPSFWPFERTAGPFSEGLEITACTDLCRQWMNQWPVLFLTLKDIQGSTFEEAFDLLQFAVSSLCMEHDYLENSDQVKNAAQK